MKNGTMPLFNYNPIYIMRRNKSVIHRLHDELTDSSHDRIFTSDADWPSEFNIGLDLDSEPDIEYKSARKFVGFFINNKKKTTHAKQDNSLTLITMMLALNKQQLSLAYDKTSSVKFMSKGMRTE